MSIMRKIKEKVLNREYEFTIPHFFEEMTEDNLTLKDIEFAISKGEVRRKFTRDPRGTRYEIVGTADDGREIAIICRIKSTGKVLFITTYALK